MTLNAIRIARPVTDLSLSSHMYCTGLGLEQIAQFADHDGFSGVMVGRRDLGWHLEFTLCHHHPVKPSPGAFNPYWNVNGKTFVDGDGYRVVLQNRSWP